MKPSTTPHDSESLFVHNALFDIMNKQSWTMGSSLLLVCAVLAAIGFRPEMVWYWVAWLIFMTVSMYAPRVIGARFFAPSDDIATARRALRWTIGDAFNSGAGASLCLLAFPILTINERLLYTIILMSVALGNVLNAGAHPKVFWAFSAPIIGLLSLMWFLYPNPNDATLLRYSVSALLLIPLVPMSYVFVQNIWTLFDESCRMRFRENVLNTQLQKALVTAEQANHSKTRFLAAASHDLRQPLHVISLVGSALQLRSLDDISNKMVNVLNKASNSLQSLLSSLLDVSKLDSNLFEAQLTMVSMADFTNDFYQAYAPLALDKGLTPRLSMDVPETCWVMTDTGLLLRVLHNLGENALKFTTQGQVCIHLTTDKDDVVLEIEDTGCGIAPKHQEEIFQEFFQVDNHARDVNQGLGLGLSIVQRVSHLLNITVQCSSEVGRGTRMCLRIPMVLPTQKQSSITAHDHQHAASIPAGLRVLVIDDEVSVLDASRLLLEQLGCTVWTALDLKEAYACLHDMQPHRPDFMMVDFRLKGMNGIDVMQALHQTLGEPLVSTILVSGDTAPERLLLARQAGVRICHKPLTLERLRTELGVIFKA